MTTKTKAGKKHNPPRARKQSEFEIEGDLSIHFSGPGYFLIDDCALAEFVQRHFGLTRDKSGMGDSLELGRCKVLIIPVKE